MVDLSVLKNYPEYQKLYTDKNLGDNVCLLTIGGSHAYGLANENSDIDIRGIAFHSKDDLMGFKKFNGYTVNHDKCDIKIYTIENFFKLAINGNISVLEMLYCDEDDIIKYSIPMFKLRKQNLFLSNDCYKSIKGMLFSYVREYYKYKERNLDGTKYLMNIVRLLGLSYELFCWGRFVVNINKMSCFKDIEKIIIDVDEYSKDYFEEIILSHLYDFYKRSKLPEHCDAKQAEQLLIKLNVANLIVKGSI